MPHCPYILAEGIDGSGKDSQIDLLAEHLRSLAVDPLRVAEPDSELPTGQLLRQLLRAGDLRESHAALFLADRMALQTRKIAPALASGRPVLSSRSFLSTLVYQQENWPLEWLLDIHRQLPVRPDIVYIFDLPASEALQRVASRGAPQEYYERIDIQERNQKRYLDVAARLQPFLAPGGIVAVVNASRDKQSIHAEVIAILDCWMKSSKG